MPATGAAGTALMPATMEWPNASVISSRGNARATSGTTTAALRATRLALSGLPSQSATHCAASTCTSFSDSTLGVRKLLVMNRPSAPAMRVLLRGTIPVWGIGSPKGRRNSATTANQSAQAPTMPASANART